MTNNEIILTAATAAGIITTEQTECLSAHGYDIPIHTYQFWKQAGYQVRKGEKATLKLNLWNPVKTDEGIKMHYKKSALFTWLQVDKADGSGTRDTLLLAAENTTPVKQAEEEPEIDIEAEIEEAIKAAEEEDRKLAENPVVLVTPEPEKEKSLSIEDCTGDNELLKFKYYHDGIRGSWELHLSEFLPMNQRHFKMILSDIMTNPHKDRLLTQVKRYLLAEKKFNSGRYNKTKTKTLDGNIRQIAAIA